MTVSSTPLRLIDAARQRDASFRKVRSREVIDVLLDLRSAIVLETTLATLRADLVGTQSRRHAWLPRHEPEKAWSFRDVIEAAPVTAVSGNGRHGGVPMLQVACTNCAYIQLCAAPMGLL